MTGNAKGSADTQEFQAQIDSQTAQLAAKEKEFGELQQTVTEKDETIADLTAQLAALQAPAPDAGGNPDAKKQKSADDK